MEQWAQQDSNLLRECSGTRLGCYKQRLTRSCLSIRFGGHMDSVESWKTAYAGLVGTNRAGHDDRQAVALGYADAADRRRFVQRVQRALIDEVRRQAACGLAGVGASDWAALSDLVRGDEPVDRFALRVPGVLPECPPARSIEPRLAPVPSNVVVEMTRETDSTGASRWVFEAMSSIELRDPSDGDRQFTPIVP